MTVSSSYYYRGTRSRLLQKTLARNPGLEKDLSPLKLCKIVGFCNSNKNLAQNRGHTTDLSPLNLCKNDIHVGSNWCSVIYYSVGNFVGTTEASMLLCRRGQRHVAGKGHRRAVRTYANKCTFSLYHILQHGTKHAILHLRNQAESPTKHSLTTD